MKLHIKTVKESKPKEKSYKIFDGQGLYLEVLPNGSKLWRLKYRYLKKEKRISLGQFPIVSLAEAREKCREAKKLLDKGGDPSLDKQKQKIEKIRKAGSTFKAVALEWHENQHTRWSKDHSANVLHRLETDIFPTKGNMPISDIEAPDVLMALRKIEKRDALDIAGRTRQICGQVFRWSTPILRSRFKVNLLGLMGHE